MGTVCKIAFALGLAAALASPALAQPGGGGGRGGFGRGAGALDTVLTNASVQKELKFDDDEKTKVTDAVAKVKEDNKDDVAKLQDRTTSREDRADIVKKLNAAYDKAVTDILTAEQKTRLKQITLQQQGVQAFTSDDVVKSLSLTDDQKSKIKDIADKAATDIQALRGTGRGNGGGGGGGGGGGRGGQNAQKIQEIRKQALEDVTKLLTDDQKKSWKDMTGEPFQMQTTGGRGRGPGGGTTPPRTPAD